MPTPPSPARSPSRESSACSWSRCSPKWWPGSARSPRRLTPRLLASHDAVLLGQHGAVTVGADPWTAYLFMEKLEHAATIIKAAHELAGSEEGIRRLTPSQIADLMRTYSKKRPE
ncbi:MAG: class II aldolase/adducin family protein [Elusimicrobia bacterium]|nr:class II aldolase/adducin family protein [Elusimicrobiota bacterium]